VVLYFIGKITKTSNINGKNGYFVCSKGKAAITRAMSLKNKDFVQEAKEVRHDFEQ
jgi:hypothetical protein